MKMNGMKLLKITLLLVFLAVGAAAQATVKTVTYTITGWEIVNNSVKVTFTRDDGVFDPEAGSTFTTYFSKSSLDYYGDKAGNFSVELADGFNFHAYWSAGSNVQISNNSFRPGNTNSYISYNVSCSSEYLEEHETQYYVTHVTLKSAEGGTVYTTSPSKKVDFEYENVSGFNQTYKSSSWVGQLIVTYSDVPLKLDLSLNEVDGRYWGTFYSSAGYLLPEGAAAFSMDQYNYLHRIGTDGRTIPATTAVVILSDQKDITLNYTTESATLHGINILKGSVSPVALKNGQLGNAIPYVVGVVNSTLGLYPFTGSELPAGKAFYANGTEVYLSTLTSSSFTATDGQTLIGTLTSNVKIHIADGATVTLQDVSISAGSSAGITCNGNATLILSGTNMVKSIKHGYPGIRPGGSGTTLTIRGAGSLTVTGKAGGAGIGSGYQTGDCGNIVIESGIIVAKGGGDTSPILSGNGSGAGAGIGGCESGGKGKSCGKITISGGDVTAIGGSFYNTQTNRFEAATGIGSVGDASCGTITITSGVSRVSAVVTDYVTVKDCIGRSHNNSSCGKIKIGSVVYWDGSNYQEGGETYLKGTDGSFLYQP